MPPRGPTGARTGLGGPWRDSAPLASRAPCAPRGSLSLPSWSRPSRLPGQGLDSEAWSLPAASAGPAGSASSPLGPPPAPPPEWPRESLRAGQTREGQPRDRTHRGLPPGLRARVSAAWCLCCPPPPEPPGEPTPPTTVQGSGQHLGLCARAAPHWDSLPRDTRSTAASQTLAIRAHLRPPSRGSVRPRPELAQQPPREPHFIPSGLPTPEACGRG